MNNKDKYLESKYVKAGTLLSPLPVVMVSCQSQETPANIVTVAWVGIVNSEPPMISVSIRPERHSHKIIKDSSEFVVNLVDKDLLNACDFCGVKSGRDFDKFEYCKLEKIKIDGMEQTPGIASSPLCLGCKVKDVISLGSHDMFLAEIVSCRLRGDVLDENQRIRIEEIGLVSYAHGQYMELGPWLAFFGSSLAKKEIFNKKALRYKRYNSRFKQVKKSSKSR